MTDEPLEESRNNNGGSGKPSPLSLTKGEYYDRQENRLLFIK